jgi:hypothetical protein
VPTGDAANGIQGVSLRRLCYGAFHNPLIPHHLTQASGETHE